MDYLISGPSDFDPVGGGGSGDGSPSAPRVALVGAGPGDPELLTLKALKRIESADIVLHDELVSEEILALIPPRAERVAVGKAKGSHSHTQDQINRALVAASRRAKRVVRLKGGDPSLFARAGEELDFLRRHGVAVEIVPGVTAALGCAAAAGFPLTDRRAASEVIVVAGHARDCEPPPDWRGVAAKRRTIVVYMGLSVAGAIAEKLIAAGLPANTPAAVIENGTRPDQRVSTGTLGELGRLAERQKDGPGLLVIGDVLRLSPAWTPAEPAWTAAW
jgi:uroporphyrin-III C-methyltransferase/precorrin-2 dehydrogenase/sirohydrochlorin ferrochelatase